MSAKVDQIFRRLGYFLLLMAGFFLLLFLANLRSRSHYAGPNYGFILWLFAWAAISGMGLLRLRRWAVLLLFLPGLFSAFVLCVGLIRSSNLSTFVVLLNVSFVAFLVALPFSLLPYWSDLYW